MEIPIAGDTIVRTADDVRFTVAQIIDAGGENLIRLESGEEISEASFVREHHEGRATYEVVR